MKQSYVNQEALNVAAKDHKATVVVDPDPKTLYPDSKAVHYYVVEDGTVHKQLAIVEGGHIMLNGLFLHVDDVVPLGTAGTVRMPATGDVLSVPRHDVGETLAGYYLRTSKQSGADPCLVGDLLAIVADKSNLDSAPVKKDKDGKVIAKFVPVRTGEPLTDWPLLVDTF